MVSTIFTVLCATIFSGILFGSFTSVTFSKASIRNLPVKRVQTMSTQSRILMMYTPSLGSQAFTASRRTDVKVTNRMLRTCLNRNSLCSVPNSIDSTKKGHVNVCIIGGGFGGLYTALKLSKLCVGKDDALSITIIDKKPQFVFLPLLYELTTGAASMAEVSPRYETLLADSKINYIQGTVESFDLHSRVLNIQKSFPSSSPAVGMTYDYLVLGMGSQPRTAICPGVNEYALPFYTSEDAFRLRSALQHQVESLEGSLRGSKSKQFIHVVVIGASYIGIEIACNVAEFIGSRRAVVTIIERSDKVMPSAPDFNRNEAIRCLEARGINVLLNVSVEEVTRTAVTIVDNGHKVDLVADITILAAGAFPAALTSSFSTSRIAKDKFGKLLVDRTLRVVPTSGDPAVNSSDSGDTALGNVFALGDCSSVVDIPLPSTAQVAMQQADVVAQNIATLASRKRSPLGNSSATPKLASFSFLNLGEMLTLGVGDGAVSSLGGLVSINGPFAALARRLVYAVRMPTNTQTLTALLSAGITTAGAVYNVLKTSSQSPGPNNSRTSNTEDIK